MAKKAKNPVATMKTPPVFACERKEEVSDGIYMAGKWGDWDGEWLPVIVREKSVRGTISNRQPTDGEDPLKLNAKISVPNLQTIDVAMLPKSCDTLRASFTLRVLGGAQIPSACNDPVYRDKFSEVVSSYMRQTGCHEIARRNVCNMANGRWLWRNRLASEEIRIVIRLLDKGAVAASWEFDALAIPTDGFDGIPEEAARKIDEIAGKVAETLAAPAGAYLLLDVCAYARVGRGQEVYPSQELIMDRGKRGKSRVLYVVDGVAAGLHSQKIGNALRTIDTWYPCDDPHPRPISVEPYGSVTSLGVAYRQPQDKRDFYSLLDAWVLRDEEPKNPGDRDYVIANIIRGGVYGEGKDKNGAGEGGEA